MCTQVGIVRDVVCEIDEGEDSVDGRSHISRIRLEFGSGVAGGEWEWCLGRKARDLLN